MTLASVAPYAYFELNGTMALRTVQYLDRTLIELYARITKLYEAGCRS